MTENDRIAELIDYANYLLDAGIADEDLFECAATVARAVRDGLFDIDGITDNGLQHLIDLYENYES